MNSSSSTKHECTVAATVAPEDIVRGDYITELNEIYELPSFLWCGDVARESREEPVRVRYRATDAGLPLLVRAVCLPFVFVKTPQGQHRTLDVRGVSLVRLDRNYADLAWSKLKNRRRK